MGLEKALFLGRVMVVNGIFSGKWLWGVPIDSHDMKSIIFLGWSRIPSFSSPPAFVNFLASGIPDVNLHCATSTEKRGQPNKYVMCKFEKNIYK